MIAKIIAYRFAEASSSDLRFGDIETKEKRLMIATFRSQRRRLARAALTALLLAAFAFLASVIIGSGDPSFTAVATAVGA